MRGGIRALLLPAVIVGTLASLLGAPPWVRLGAGLTLPLYLAVEWRRQRTMARLMVVGSLSLTVIALLRMPAPGAALAAALERAAFFATFIACLGMLRMAAATSPLVKRCGAALIRQPPRWRYATLSVGATAFGIILNLGVIALLGVMSLKGNTLEAAGGHEIVQRVRRRRMLTAVLRGFSLSPIVSPLGICLAVILSSYPDLRWVTLLPYTLGTAAILFLVGWLQDRLQAPRRLAELVPVTEPAGLGPLAAFAAVLLGIVVLTFAAASAAGTRLPVAVLFTVPLSAFIWMALQRRRLGGGLGLLRAARAFGRRSRKFFPGMRTEVAVLGSAGFIGELLSAMLPRTWLATHLAASGLHGPGLAAAATAAVVVAAQLGLNPIVSVTLLASVLSDTAALGVPEPVMAAGLMAGWGLAMATSPLTASMLMTARLGGVSPYTVGYRWNGPYVLAAMLILWLAATAAGLLVK